jgi:hypothetical protein
LINYYSLDTIIGAGNSNQILNYCFSIKEITYDYLRLCQKDYDGQTECSYNITNCNDTKQDSDFVLFPNPNDGVFMISHNSMFTFEVLDAFGKSYFKETSSRINFNLSDLSFGKYFMKLTSEREVQILRFIKK